MDTENTKNLKTKSKYLLGYNNKKDRNIFLLCWMAYGASYICRLNFSAVIPNLMSEGILSETRIASVSSAFFISYGLGQLFSGVIGDKFNTRYMIFWGVLLSAVSNILICFFHSFSFLIILWALNGMFQSLIWTPILKIASVEYDDKSRDKFGIDMASTVPIGTVLAYAVSLITMMFLSWKFVFLSCGAILFIVSIIWILETGKLSLKRNAKNSIEQIKWKKIFNVLISCGAIIFAVPIIAQGTLKDSVTQWIPEFFSSQFNLSTSFSLLLTMILPIINVTGAFFAKAVNNRIKSETKTSAVFFSISLIFLIVLLFSYNKNLVISLISMICITNCMFAINVMLITIVPLRFSKYGIVGTVAGLFNACAYIGCGITNQLAGGILENSGWKITIIFWIFLAVLAILFCIPKMKKI